MPEKNRTYRREFGNEVNEILSRSEDYGDPDRNRNFTKIDHVFETAHRVLDKGHIDVLLLFEGVTDWVQHRYWKYYEPDKFDFLAWDIRAEDVEQARTLIPDTYAHVDRRLGELIEKLEEDALLIVVSDHGQLALTSPQVSVRLDHLSLIPISDPTRPY